MVDIMKVTFIGTGTMGSITRNNTSVLFDDILFDIGMGTIKQIERFKIYAKSIKYIVITHFHADHFLDLPNLLIGKKMRNELDETLTFIGPKGLREKMIHLMTSTHADGNEHKFDNIEEFYNLKLIELGNGESFETEDFKITALDQIHLTCKPVNGYILEKDNKTIGYVCDGTFSDNYYKMCENLDYLFSDVTGLKTSQAHVGLEDYLELYKKYPNCKFYAIHRGDYELPETEYVQFPMDGDTVII